jgi:hypothetical protein
MPPALLWIANHHPLASDDVMQVASDDVMQVQASVTAANVAAALAPRWLIVFVLSLVTSIGNLERPA